MDYWALVKTLRAETQALQLIDQGCLTNIGVMIEPVVGSSKLTRHNDATIRLQAASNLAISGASRFRPPELGYSVPRPKQYGLDCTLIARMFRVGVDEILARSLPELTAVSMQVMAIIDAETLLKMEVSSSALRLDTSAFALKLRKRDLRRTDLASLVKKFIGRFDDLGNLSLYLDLGSIRAENLSSAHDTVVQVAPLLSKAHSWSHLLLGANSCPDWTMLPKAGEEVIHDRSDLTLIEQLLERIPRLEYCDRGIVGESFRPRKVDDRPSVRHPPFMTVTTKTQFRSARESDSSENYAVHMEKLTKQLVGRHEDEFYRCRPLDRLLGVGQRSQMISTRKDRISDCLALHINQTYLSVRNRTSGSAGRR